MQDVSGRAVFPPGDTCGERQAVDGLCALSAQHQPDAGAPFCKPVDTQHMIISRGPGLQN